MASLRPFLLAGAGAALATTSAQAQSTVATGNFVVAGNVPQVCTMERGRVRTGGIVNFVGLDGSTLRISQLVDPNTLAARPSSVTVTFDAVCNFPHAVRIESENNGLWPTDGRMSSDIGGFAYALPYTARIQWATRTGN